MANDPQTTLAEKMRGMANGCKEIGATYDYQELLQLGAVEIERLMEENTWLDEQLEEAGLMLLEKD